MNNKTKQDTAAKSSMLISKGDIATLQKILERSERELVWVPMETSRNELTGELSTRLDFLTALENGQLV